MFNKGITVLVVDDSPVVRQVLSNYLNDDPAIGNVQTSPDGHLALRKIKKLDPDIVTLDIEMPEMDGLSTLRQIMADMPRPVIMLSAYTSKGAVKTIRALELGAVDFIQKPSGRYSKEVGKVCDELVAKIKAIAKSPRLLKIRYKPKRLAPTRPAPTRPVRVSRGTALSMREVTRNLVAIGASTGGTEAILKILQQFPSEFPAGIVIAQHMPEGFTRSFADRLNQVCEVNVKEAEHRDMIQPGRALLAPGHSHLEVRSSEYGAFVELNRKPKVSGHRPSVDALFRSVAREFGKKAVGVLLTGMGRDGADGMGTLNEIGALTIAQDESSCVVFGMPKAAIDAGNAQIVADLSGIARTVRMAIMTNSSNDFGRASRCNQPEILVNMGTTRGREK